MWVLRLLTHVVLRAAGAAVVALAVASFQSFFAGDPFLQSLKAACEVVGALVVLTGVLRGSNLRLVTPENELEPGERALLVMAGAVVLALGLALG